MAEWPFYDHVSEGIKFMNKIFIYKIYEICISFYFIFCTNESKGKMCTLGISFHHRV